jgi:CHAD domain-containing protein
MTVRSDPIEGGRTDSEPMDVERAGPMDVDRAEPTNVEPAEPTDVERAKLVHETRKTIKRMRALGRLLRYELGEQELERVEDSLRTAGRRLAGARDAEVRLATLERLRARHPRALELKGVERLNERLRGEREQTGELASPRDVLKDIEEMRRALRHWNLVDPDFDALSPGLRRLYGEGRRRHARLKREHGCDAERVHDWRKRVKALYYALDMLGASDAKGARGVTRRAKHLGELLGEEHDLWMLGVYVECHPDACGEDTSAHERLLKLIERRRKRLRKRALAGGARLYRRKPRKFARRIGDSLRR